MPEEQAHNLEGEEEPEYVSAQEVEEVVDEVEGAEEPKDDDLEDDEAMDAGERQIGAGARIDQQGNLEIDLSNNSIAYFDEHTDSIFTVATHPTLPLAATGGGDNVTYLWTTHTSPSRLVGKLEGYTESVIGSGFTADGKYLVTGDMTGQVLIHKSKKRGQIWEQYGQLQQVEEVSWITVHPKEDIFAFGSTDGSVWVYQIGDNSAVELIFTGYSHSLDCTAGEFFDVDNDNGELKLLTVSEDGTVIGWNCYTQQQLFRLDSTQMKGISPPWVSLAVNDATGKTAAIGSRDSQAAIVNLENGTIVNIFTVLEPKGEADVYDSSIEGISWCRSLNFLALGLVSGDIFIYDTHTWNVRKNLRCGDSVTKLEFFKDTPLLLGSSMDGKAYKWDSRTGETVYTYTGHHLGVLDFGIDCGNRLITAGDEGVSLVFDI
ncbi:DEKNAAC102747 [Brettanomyces naardenensis]|uniref:DEKNAAC102747 n=1 Tax=Brettanomyces naardenensis TaxID=13370 RepID=A0A448YK47_BRENA|nr:DEKNAAC102747 [Brettanomyces naardenensis]